VDLSADGKILAQVSFLLAERKLEPAIHLWDTVTGKQLRTLSGSGERPGWLRFAPDGKRLAATYPDGIRLWEVATGKLLHHLKGPAHAPLGFAPDGKLLAYAGEDGSIRLWDPATAKELRRWATDQQGLRQLVFAPDGKSLASVALGGVRVWEVATGKQLARFDRAPEDRIFALAFSPSARAVATGEFGRQTLPNGDTRERLTIRLQEVLSGQEIRQIDVPQGLVAALAFAPDGRTLASGGTDSTILLWDVTGGVAAGAPRALPLTAKELTALWSDLGGHASTADGAIWALTQAPQQSVPFLQERLRPVAPADAQQVAKLVAELDNKNYAVRQAATRALEDLGATAEAALYKILAGNPSLELRRRLEEILAKRHPEVIRQLRGIEALEQIGTPEARQALEVLAQVMPNPRLAQAAGAALERLAWRPVAIPG
jgi:hypothetical protein